MKTEKLSKNRNLLFGIAAIGVLMVHSLPFVQWPSLLNRLCGFGGVGVYVFAFLSGMGLYISMSKNSAGGGIRQFYQKRFLRVGLTYLLIAGCWYAIKHLLISFAPLDFLYELSTLSFWIDHKGAWYVAMLIPLYLIYPYFYKLLSRQKQGVCIVVFSVAVLVFSYLLYAVNRDMYTHLSQVMNSLFVFVLGNYMGIKLLRKDHISPMWLFITLLAYPVRACIPEICDSAFFGNLTYGLLGIAICMAVSMLARFLPMLLRKMLEWFGNISLELYLTNIFLIQALNILLEHGKFANVNGWIAWMGVYLILCLVGIMLSVGASKLTQIISRRVVDAK